MEYAEEYLGLKGRAFAEEFVLRKQMDGVKQVTAKKPAVSGGGGGGAWGTSGGGGVPQVEVTLLPNGKMAFLEWRPLIRASLKTRTRRRAMDQ